MSATTVIYAVDAVVAVYGTGYLAVTCFVTRRKERDCWH